VEHEMPFPPQIMAAAVKYIVLFITAVIALSLILGSEHIIILTWTFLIVIIALFVGVGASFAWGLRDVSSNLSGYLQISRSVKEGDHITVLEYSGRVKEINRYSTVIVTDEGEEVTVPNSLLVKSVMVKRSA